MWTNQLPAWARRAAIIAVLVLLVSVLGLGLAGARPPSPAARAAALGDAMRRWRAHSFERYRLVLQAPSWCRVDAEIVNERIVKVYENTCPGRLKTVTDLFAFVQEIDAHPDTIYCAANGCECLEQRFAQAEYDAQFGFPLAIRMRRQRSANWDGLWGYLLAHGLPNCLAPPDTDLVRVLSFRPLG